jgi:hypothetical protein
LSRRLLMAARAGSLLSATTGGPLLCEVPAAVKAPLWPVVRGRLASGTESCSTATGLTSKGLTSTWARQLTLRWLRWTLN